MFDFSFFTCRRFSHVWHVFANGIREDRIDFEIVGHRFWNLVWIVRFPAIFHFILMKYVSKQKCLHFMVIFSSNVAPELKFTNAMTMNSTKTDDIRNTSSLYTEIPKAIVIFVEWKIQ